MQVLKRPGLQDCNRRYPGWVGDLFSLKCFLKEMEEPASTPSLLAFFSRIANLCCAACFSRPAAARARVSEPWSQNAVPAL